MNPIKYLQNRLELRRAYARLFSSPDGQTVLKHLAAEAGITNPKLSDNSTELLVREGRQQIVYSILRESQQGDDFLLKQIEQVNQQPNTHEE